MVHKPSVLDRKVLPVFLLTVADVHAVSTSVGVLATRKPFGVRPPRSIDSFHPSQLARQPRNNVFLKTGCDRTGTYLGEQALFRLMG